MIVEQNESNLDPVVGEIVDFDADTVQARFLGAEFTGNVPVIRATLEAAGVTIAPEVLFAADVNLGAEKPEEVQPTNFRYIVNEKTMELWRS